jgi:hypothetical protein
MKTSAVLASLLFGSFAVAAPVDKRALVYKTETVIETVVVYTTVYDDEPVVQATQAPTTSDGAFYQKPSTSVVVKPTSSAAPVSSAAPISSAAPVSAAPASPSVAPAYTPVAPVKSSSIYTPPAPTSTSTSTPTPTPTPAPAPETSSAAAPEPSTTVPAYTPAPVTSAAPAPTVASSSGGAQFSNVDMTIYDNVGAAGACGKAINDGDMIVALAQEAWGASTYDTMTGDATNPWCGQKIKIDYKGNSIEATIMDLCPGCSGHDIDLSLAAWTQLTGLAEKTRLKASWSKMD